MINKNFSRSVKSQGKSLILSTSVKLQGIIFSLHTEFGKRKRGLKMKSGIFSSVLPCFLQGNGSDHDRNRHPVDPCGAECTGRPTFHLHSSCQCIFLATNRSSVSAFHPLDQSYRKGW